MRIVAPRISQFTAAAALSAAVILAGCSSKADKERADKAPIDKRDTVTVHVHPALKDTIGEYAIFADSAPLPVEGWGVVAGLPNTGSGDMDPDVRAQLTEQLYRVGAGSYSKGTEGINPERILASNQIAAVQVRGVISPLARRGDTFDLVVKALPNTQTTSLADGLLWTSELKVIGLRADLETHTIALGRGPVFIPGAISSSEPSTQPSSPATKVLRTGRIIGGGYVSEPRLIRLQLLSPSLRLAGAIQRVLNSRFPGRDRCASADSDTLISLNVPSEFVNNPGDFIELVRHMYLAQDVPGFSERKAAELTKLLQDPTAPLKEISLALQGLGRSVLPDYIQPLYTSPNPATRYWAARAGAGLSDVGGMVVLQEFAKDAGSPFRDQAIDSIVSVSHGGDTIRATLALMDVLNGGDTAQRISAYNGLVAIRSRAVRTYSVAKKFFLDLVPSDGPPLVYVSQTGSARIALIGKGFTLPPGALFVSADNALTVNVADGGTDAAAPADSDVVTASSIGDTNASPIEAAPEKVVKDSKDNVVLYWRSPLGDRDISLKTSSNVADIIARLAWSPDPLNRSFDPKTVYIGASYQRVVDMLAAMCADQSIPAKFVMEKAVDPASNATDALLNSRPEGSTATVPTVQSLNAPVSPAAPAKK